MATSNNKPMRNGVHAQNASEGDDGDHLQYLLTAYLFENLSAAGRQEVEKHLQGCASCRERLDRQKAMLGELETALDDGEREYVFEERRRKRILEAAKQSRFSLLPNLDLLEPLRVRWKLSALAALLFLFVVGGLLLPVLGKSRQRMSPPAEHARAEAKSAAPAGKVGSITTLEKKAATIDHLIEDPIEANPGLKKEDLERLRREYADPSAETAAPPPNNLSLADSAFGNTESQTGSLTPKAGYVFKGKPNSKTPFSPARNSKVASDIVVPPDVLKKAELSDGFEEIRVDRPDTQSALGNPDAQMFKKMEEKDARGGGVGGASLDELIEMGANSPGDGRGWGGGKGIKKVPKGSGQGSFDGPASGKRFNSATRSGGAQGKEEPGRDELSSFSPSRQPLPEPNEKPRDNARSGKEREYAWKKEVGDEEEKSKPGPGLNPADDPKTTLRLEAGLEIQIKEHPGLKYGPSKIQAQSSQGAQQKESDEKKLEVYGQEDARYKRWQEKDGDSKPNPRVGSDSTLAWKNKYGPNSLGPNKAQPGATDFPSKNGINLDFDGNPSNISGLDHSESGQTLRNEIASKPEPILLYPPAWRQSAAKAQEPAAGLPPVAGTYLNGAGGGDGKGGITVTGVGGGINDKAMPKDEDLAKFIDKAKKTADYSAANEEITKSLKQRVQGLEGRLDELSDKTGRKEESKAVEGNLGQAAIDSKVGSFKIGGLINPNDPARRTQDNVLGKSAKDGGINLNDPVEEVGKLFRGAESFDDLSATELALRGYQHFHAENERLTFADFRHRPAHVPPAVLTDEGLDEDEFIARHGVRPFVDASRDHLSTFSMDVDTSSYTHARASLQGNKLPEPESVRVEEFVNYFKQPYTVPGDEAFGVFAEGGPSLFGGSGGGAGEPLELLKIGIKSREARPDERKPAMLTLVVDTSGSMVRDGLIDLVRGALKSLVNELSPEDAVAIVAFGGTAELVLPRTPARQKERILDAIATLAPRGGTNVEAGLNLGYRMADEAYSAEAVNRVILCSDGVANVGPKGPETILQRVKVFAARGIDLVTVGFGKGAYNDRMMEKLSNQGNGSSYFVDKLEEAQKIFREQLPPHLEVLARDAKVQVEFNPEAVARYRLLGYENRAIADKDFRNDAIDAGEVAHNTLVTALYEIQRKPAGHGALGKVFLRWKDAGYRHLPVIERHFPLPEGLVADEAGRASPELRFLACVAEFAELLRGSRWACDGSFGAVLMELAALPPAFRERDEWKEVFGMVTRAQALSVEQWKREVQGSFEK